MTGTSLNVHQKTAHEAKVLSAFRASERIDSVAMVGQNAAIIVSQSRLTNVVAVNTTFASSSFEMLNNAREVPEVTAAHMALWIVVGPGIIAVVAIVFVVMSVGFIVILFLQVKTVVSFRSTKCKNLIHYSIHSRQRRCCGAESC